jgi:ubiquinone/menaquinone biosynthesis C-methylase UbiE
MTGVDFVETLIEAAHNFRDDETTLGSRPDFIHADAIKYLRTCDSRSVNYVITERFLNNLPSFQTQKDVILEVYRVLIPGGRLLMCEGSENGFEALNELRAALGLARIPARSKDNISAIRFKDAQIEDFVQSEVGFSLRSKDGFGMYFVISRVLRPVLVMP